ncbi:MAG TPA: ABC transporter ATP-binding protein [Sphingomicrobium sp.]|nr:ABC transporter ATP-binding protein [Sphingomicrobium sp.]
MGESAEPGNLADGGGSASALRSVYRGLPRNRQRQLWALLLLSIVGGLAELITIGAIVPFLSLLASSETYAVPGVAEVFALLGADSRSERLTTATGLFNAAALAAGAIRLLLAWTSQSFVQRLGHDLATEIQRRILGQPYSYHLAHNSSEVVASLELVHQLSYGVIQPLIQAAAGAVIALFVVAGVAAVDARTALLASAAFGLSYAAVILLYRRRLHGRSAIIAAAYGERVRLVQESIGGIRDMIVDHAQDAHVEAFRRVDGRLTRARTETVLASVAPRFLVEAAGMVILALVALILARSAGGFAAALPILGALALGAQRLLPLVNQLYQGWSLAAANRAIASRVVQLLSLPVSEASAPVPPLPFAGSIEFRSVSFRYPGRQKPALDRIDVTLRRGERIALTGPTGSGKSTFADLLMGLLAPTEGAIVIDGSPLDGAARSAWQRSIAHVPQSIFLIDASIARNIALSAPDLPIDPDRVIAAAEAAQLGAFLATLPDGIDTLAGERGVRLSGGQRQRIGIARALYKQAPVLILDEATSALDEATEEQVMRALDSIPGLTLLVIAHRPSTIDRCGLKLRLNQGRLEPLPG